MKMSSCYNLYDKSESTINNLMVTDGGYLYSKYSNPRFALKYVGKEITSILWLSL